MLDFKKNYFDLFGLPVSYVVDMDRLAMRYHELQRVMHPDRYASASDHERRLSIQGATQVNQAHETLKDPIQRARYMLSLKGMDLSADNETTKDAVFLMEQLELREALEEARGAPDPYAAIAEQMVGINKRINSLVGQMAVQLETGEPEQLEVAKEMLRKMQFMRKLQNDAESIEAELDEAL